MGKGTQAGRMQGRQGPQDEWRGPHQEQINGQMAEEGTGRRFHWEN